MKTLFLLWSGYVWITVTGAKTERFLNLCKSRGILLEELSRKNDSTLILRIAKKDFFLLGPIRRKTQVQIKIQKKCGLPFFFYRNKKRKAFFLGIGICLICLYLLSGRIWNIHIEGNHGNSTPEILQFLKNHQVVHGMDKKQINCSEIAALLREEYPSIAWVSVKISGTRLLMVIKEGIGLSQTEASTKPCNLIADVPGTIVRMVTRRGVPVKKPGDICKKGDLLVAGVLPIKNDEQEVVRYEQVAADADIYVRTSRAYYDEFPLKHQKLVLDSQHKKGFYLKIGSWFLGGCEAKKGYCCITEEYPLRITETFVLPVFFGKITLQKYHLETSVYTTKEAKALSFQRLYEYEENLMRKGVQISENNVKIRKTHTTCISSGSLWLIQKSGKEISLSRYEQLTERTATDG